MLSTLDLFSGAGGLTLGFKQAGYECFAAVEIDRFSVETFARHTPNARIYDTDVCNVDFRYLRGQIDVVIGGPPCQPFSVGGLQEGDMDHRDMVPEFFRIVEEVQPPAFLMENVPGLASASHGEYFNQILLEFRRLGYQVNWKVLKAEEYGVPQIRRRLIIVGMRHRKFEFPSPTHGSSSNKLPIITAGKVVGIEPRGIPNNCKVYYAKNVQLRPSPHHGLLFNGGGRCINLNAPAPTIISSAGGNKTHFIDTLGVVAEYHASLMSGGTPREGAVPGCRRLTTLESALLQTFPEELVFAGPTSAQYRQIGNAVPPSLAKAIAVSIKQQLLLPALQETSNLAVPAAIQNELFGEINGGEEDTVATKSIGRNMNVEAAVKRAVECIDKLIEGETVVLPSAQNRRAIDLLLEHESASVALATYFLLFYSLVDKAWNRKHVPAGTRGAYGDKRLSEQLKLRRISLINNVVAFGENVGWKGNVRNTIDFTTDKRFSIATQILSQPEDEREKMAAYFSSCYEKSRVAHVALPAVGDDVLTFGYAKKLFYDLIKIPSEGFVQQYLVASILSVHRRRYSHEIKTHHPHAADRFDNTAGDIEEFRSGQLVMAYEVTVREDWQNRIASFKEKMDKFGLTKYVIFADKINCNPAWSEPASVLSKLKPYGRDIAVVDIYDFLNVFAAELTPLELREAVNKAYDLLSSPTLGAEKHKAAYRETVGEWLDLVSSNENTLSALASTHDVTAEDIK